MSGYLNSRVGALDPKKVAGNVILQAEDKASLASKHSRTLSS